MHSALHMRSRHLPECQDGTFFFFFFIQGQAYIDASWSTKVRKFALRFTLGVVPVIGINKCMMHHHSKSV